MVTAACAIRDRTSMVARAAGSSIKGRSTRSSIWSLVEPQP